MKRHSGIRGLSTTLILSMSCLWAHSAFAQLVTTPVKFSQLPGWSEANPTKSFNAFKVSCAIILTKPQDERIVSRGKTTKAGDWFPACTAANKIESPNDKEAKSFFEKYFTPVHFKNSDGKTGKFTGYYLHEINASYTKTAKFNVPVYGMPEGYVPIQYRGHSGIGKKTADGYKIFRYSRDDIDQGKIAAITPVLMWTDSRYSRYLLQVEGSGYAKFPDGKKVTLNYAGQNGKKGTMLGNLAKRAGIERKIQNSGLSADEWYAKHPLVVDRLLKYNPSFVFFQTSDDNTAIGIQGVALTPNYSIAVDTKVVPFGAPVWLTTTMPTDKENEAAFERLMIAQDTGAAIRGNVRADVYVGENSYVGKTMTSEGSYWVFFPKKFV